MKSSSSHAGPSLISVLVYPTPTISRIVLYGPISFRREASVAPSLTASSGIERVAAFVVSHGT